MFGTVCPTCQKPGCFSCPTPTSMPETKSAKKKRKFWVDFERTLVLTYEVIIEAEPDEDVDDKVKEIAEARFYSGAKADSEEATDECCANMTEDRYFKED